MTEDDGQLSRSPKAPIGEEIEELAWIAQARRDTPSCVSAVHFDHAGASPPPTPVLDVVVRHLMREAAIGGYAAADEAGAGLDTVYASVARLLNSDPDEIALTGGATQGWAAAFQSFPLAPGDRVLIGHAEFGSNVLAMMHRAARDGFQIDVVPNAEHGEICIEALKDRIDDRVKLIALTHAPTSGGLVNPAASIGKIARAAGIPYLLDACQSAGQMPLNVDELGCDMLAATGRKFLRGPRGTGFLYVRRSLLPKLTPALIDVQAADWCSKTTYRVQPGAKRFETWERSYANLLGLGAAVDYALEWGMDRIQTRVSALAAVLRHALNALPDVVVHDCGRDLSGIVTFSVAGVPAEQVRRRLAEKGIYTTVARICRARLDLEDRVGGDPVRASVHYFNTEDEIERLIAELPTAK